MFSLQSFHLWQKICKIKFYRLYVLGGGFTLAVNAIRGFTTHSLERLAERKITPDMAKYVLEHGFRTAGQGDCFVIQGRIPEKQKLEVRLVINSLGDLVTACWRRAKSASNIIEPTAKEKFGVTSTFKHAS